MRFWKKLDLAVDRIVDARVQKTNPMDAATYFKTREPRINDPRIKYLFEAVHSRHANTAALLTHISAMIAALGIILIVFNQYTTTQIFIILEMAAYTALAIICIHHLRYRDANFPKTTQESEEDYIETFYRGYIRNRQIHIYLANGVLIVTIVFLITIIAHAIALTLSI